MRSQRRAPGTVQLIFVTTIKDNLGNETTSTEVVESDGAIFNPESILERTGNDQAPVVAPAFWNVPGAFVLDADDLVIEGGDPDDVDATTWQVVGGSALWLDRTKIPVELVAND